MSQSTVKEGKIPFKIPSIDAPCFTWYKVVGDLGITPPLVVLHGGPSGGHDYLLPFSELWPRYGIPVVFYDQIGCGKSTHLPQTAGNRSFWGQGQIFHDELNNLLEHLGLRDGPGYHILGQSFGGMMSASFAGTRPRGLRRMVLASANSSKASSIASMTICRKELPPDAQQVFNKAEHADELQETPEYKAAVGLYLKTFMCRNLEPFPPEMVQTLKTMGEDTTVFKTMSGPSLLNHTGSMLGWTSVPVLHRITAPTLVYNGEFDTARDISQIPFFELIPRVRWVTFANGGHMCHLEDGLREKILTLVGNFLTQKDTEE